MKGRDHMGILTFRNGKHFLSHGDFREALIDLESCKWKKSSDKEMRKGSTLSTDGPTGVTMVTVKQEYKVSTESPKGSTVLENVEFEIREMR